MLEFISCVCTVDIHVQIQLNVVDLLSQRFSLSVQSKKSGQIRRQLLMDLKVDPASYGTIVEMASFTAGGQDVICFATTRGKLCGLDLRSNQIVWKLTNEAKYGGYAEMCTYRGFQDG